MPASFMDLAIAAAPPRPNAEHRSSFASSTFSAHSASQPLSPSSETPRSPSEAGEADEARVYRKLLDLEITNKSLLAINSALEVTKLKQAREIRELKRRLRDGRGLPALQPLAISAGSAVLSDEDDLTESDDDDDDLLVKEDPELEAAHQRCKLLVEAWSSKRGRPSWPSMTSPRTPEAKSCTLPSWKDAARARGRRQQHRS